MPEESGFQISELKSLPKDDDVTIRMIFGFLAHVKKDSKKGMRAGDVRDVLYKELAAVFKNRGQDMPMSKNIFTRRLKMVTRVYLGFRARLSHGTMTARTFNDFLDEPFDQQGVSATDLRDKYVHVEE